ncbi:hypothetical protein RhiirA5_349820 [Rhizophagus irregularis]|uniref:Uncharacterized protein n=3 Tax=Rhizophagus irregularis TaxID=588596 RepID=U9UQ55_RHIID|nr:hypothetical protein GLOIN_2v1578521 [Rhizophagus irregularis DAOM 181602=DAOM 197198]ANQ32326.1 MATA-HMG [Rhizophagus irregularis]EXX75159.1 hypothetical protein RirG_044180 [Rhizophagus irregularis DAOM 197198w]ANQ32327.1 MATA-HMG [Rhizophagus irregularis]ANQ32328.1 MATA-HMG [Rhizophagus irregularis]ANQ32329.1 MATA-HMG [Rhizophagus irregularis]|eukprot:XP_025181074.1 hypothetical protein GLOIN_2v1578521 [Rhizophagus irregularis DAOM 181602=DAOM 197198]
MFQPRTDEEIVNSTNYNFTLDISSLLSNSTITRRSKRLQRSNLRNTPRPRPQNSFTLYRRNMAARSEFVGLKSSLKSKRIADLWRNETTEVRDLFNAMARLASR